MNLVYEFEECQREQRFLLGGKGESLAYMFQSGFPVPGGFIISTSAFDLFLKESALNLHINSILRGVNFENTVSVKRAADKIYPAILAAEIPRAITDQIHSSLKILNTSRVAVRSSAAVEDAMHDSWAGVFDSFLNIEKSDLSVMVKQCWASQFSERALHYKLSSGLHRNIVPFAVVVEEMVQSEVSGVAFSMHPVAGDRKQVLIEAGIGLGDAIVSGYVVPDKYVVEKSNLRIKGKQPDTSVVLTDTEIISLTKLVCDLEVFFDAGPVDVEWAVGDGKMYVFQCRPVTTEARSSQIVYKKQYNRSLSLIECQYWDYGERLELLNVSQGTAFFEPLFLRIPGKGTDVYYNFTDPAQDTVHLFDYILRSEKGLEGALVWYEQVFSDLAREVKSVDQSIEHLFSLIQKVWPSLVIMLADREIESLNQGVQKRIYELRKNTDSIVYDATRRLMELIEESLPEQYEPYVDVLLLEEIVSNNFPPQSELEERRRGYIYFKGKVYTGKKDAHIELKNITLKTDKVIATKQFVEGSIAWTGNVAGTVKVVREANDSKKVLKGDILIAPMSTPDFLPAMQKAAAFVTDEGGITCHAAIVAREMQKPCVVGTRVATEVFKDGDYVCVDADSGVVTVTEKVD